jgi:hypothetical protein
MAKYFENYVKIYEGTNSCPNKCSLCAYKLGFGLVKTLDRKFEKKNSKTTLSRLTGHYTVHCPVHRMARADLLFSVRCPMVHRIATVGCPVRP